MRLRYHDRDGEKNENAKQRIFPRICNPSLHRDHCRLSSLATMASLAVMAEPPARHVDGAMMDYFMIELVNMVRESSAVAMARAKKVEQEMVESGLLPPPAPPAPVLPLKDNPRDSLTSIASRNSASAKTNPATEAEEAVRVRLEAIGMHVGANFTERCVLSSAMSLSVLKSCRRLCLEKMLFSETLDAVKFICKDIWTACWDKQVDNLRTNHRVSMLFSLALCC